MNNTLLPAALMSCLLAGCGSTGENNRNEMEKSYEKGKYGYDVNFLKQHNINTIELKDSLTGASVLIAPGLQGRVMTSSSEGRDGQSYGWINYRFIEAGEASTQFNPFGGEERLWLGPEGGPFSIYFKEGAEQVFANWKVPEILDTLPFDIISAGGRNANFRKDFSLLNASGTEMKIGIERSIRLLDRGETGKAIGMRVGDSLSFVAYESENVMTNKGLNEWTKETGFLSLWMLAMFNPSEQGVVFIPFREDARGVIVNDDYFGKVPADRLKISGSTIFFRTDGRHRSKIGVGPDRALPFCGSYDPVNGVLTILWYSPPGEHKGYVNSKWGKQDDPLSGDVVNSYNDGPVEDGSIMGPFYEIESSSPAALLKPGEKISHTQRIFHFRGKKEELDKITMSIFGLTTSSIEEAL
ncbi:MAG: hypothetical protein MUD02_09630 [Bacteroidales bacterium]|nr:hypothetical protein [Bacteroidales bacterium]